eukprot:Rhum_TRINITY_DN14654_c4_g1::Rhum_TRINITY_DN14654_c4_g1_i1::g.106298::m.106298
MEKDERQRGTYSHSAHKHTHIHTYTRGCTPRKNLQNMRFFAVPDLFFPPLAAEKSTTCTLWLRTATSRRPSNPSACTPPSRVAANSVAAGDTDAAAPALSSSPSSQSRTVPSREAVKTVPSPSPPSSTPRCARIAVSGLSCPVCGSDRAFGTRTSITASSGTVSPPPQYTTCPAACAQLRCPFVIATSSTGAPARASTTTKRFEIPRPKQCPSKAPPPPAPPPPHPKPTSADAHSPRTPRASGSRAFAAAPVSTLQISTSGQPTAAAALTNCPPPQPNGSTSRWVTASACRRYVRCSPPPLLPPPPSPGCGRAHTFTVLSKLAVYTHRSSICIADTPALWPPDGGADSTAAGAHDAPPPARGATVVSTSRIDGGAVWQHTASTPLGAWKHATLGHGVSAAAAAAAACIFSGSDGDEPASEGIHTAAATAAASTAASAAYFTVRATAAYVTPATSGSTRARTVHEASSAHTWRPPQGTGGSPAAARATRTVG